MTPVERSYQFEAPITQMEETLPCSNRCQFSSDNVININATKGATRSLFTEEFFQNVLGSKGTVVSWKGFKIPLQNIGLTSTCKARQTDERLVGHFGFEITYKPVTGEVALKKLRVVAKCKPLTAKFVDIFGDWIKNCGGEVSRYSDTFKQLSYFRKSDVREVKVMRSRDQRFTDIAPAVYHTEYNQSKEIFVIVMEDLTGHVTHFNTIDNAPGVWKHDDIKVVLRDVARFHSIYLDDVSSLMHKPWICVYSGSVMKELSGLWRSLLQWNHVNYPELWTAKRKRLVDTFIENLDRMWEVLESFPRTLVHYDFTPRNVCIRKQQRTTKDEQDNDVINYDVNNDVINNDVINEQQSRVSCIYDWEMATVHVPQHDVVEFLAFVLPAECDISIRENFVEFYREQLEKFSGRAFDSKTFLEVFNVTCCDYSVHQLCLKTVTHSVIRLPYFERAVNSHLGYLESLEERGSLDFLKILSNT